MKRSTIILIIYFIISIITPVIILKSCVGSTPQEQVDMWQTAIQNSDRPVRYLLVPEGENDSIDLNIHICAVEPNGNPGRTLINGEVYEKDTLLIAANSQGEIKITYEANLALIIENRNACAAFHIDEAIIDRLMISSQGDVNIEASNIGTMVITDSLGVGNVAIRACNVGSLMSSREGAQNLSVESSNVGRVSIPVGGCAYEIDDSNIGMMVNGGKRELLIGGSNAHMNVCIDVDSLDEEVVEIVESEIEEEL